MKTKFPYEGRIDLNAYLDNYFAQKDAVTELPDEQELLEIAHKAIVKDHITLSPLPQGETAAAGDTVRLAVESSLPKFNKPSVTVTLGRGLYDKALEQAVIGRRVSDRFTVIVKDEPVSVTVLDIRRRVIPEPTDEMVAALKQTDLQNRPLCTVADYEAFIRRQKTLEVLSNVNYHVMNKILEDYPIQDYDESDIKALGQLEADYFIRIFQEQDGIDLRKEVPKDWEKDMNVHSLEEFIALRHDWYCIKIHQCLVLLNILNLPCEGKTDPLDHYEVLSELTEKMYEKIEEEMKRRKTK